MKNKQVDQTQYYKEQHLDLYHLLMKCYTKGTKLTAHLMGAPEGSYELNEVYNLTSRLRKSETTEPSYLEVREGLNHALKYFESFSEEDKVDSLIQELYKFKASRLNDYRKAP